MGHYQLSMCVQRKRNHLPNPKTRKMNCCVLLPSESMSCTCFGDVFTANGTFSGTKVVVGTQLGVLSIFNRSHGWGDCVDRVLGWVTLIVEWSVLLNSVIQPSAVH